MAARLPWILIAYAASASCSRSVSRQPEAPPSGHAYLIAQQAADGGWHSEAYGALRSGAAATSLALYAISHLPLDRLDRHRDSVDRAVAFLRKGLQESGVVYSPDGTADYPNYATAMTLTALKRLEMPFPASESRRMLQCLIASQLTQTRGWKPPDPDYGGWDFIGDSLGDWRLSTGTNVSVSSFVLEALRTADSKGNEAAFTRALDWLKSCQNLPGDGGFFYTPRLQDSLNKAAYEVQGPGMEGPAHTHRQRHPRSYGTATCDGIRGLIYCGLEPNDARVRAAVRWIRERDGGADVPGFEQSPEHANWKESLRFYYYAALAKTSALVPDIITPGRRAELIEIIRSSQAPDGSWANERSDMREDDPLIATSFALIALSELSAVQ